MTPDEATAREIVAKWWEERPFSGFDGLTQSITAALRAQRPRWTTERPTVEGWYWWKGTHHDQESPACVEIVTHGPPDNRQLVTCFGDGFFTRLDVVTGEWAPVMLPEEGPNV